MPSAYCIPARIELCCPTFFLNSIPFIQEYDLHKSVKIYTKKGIIKPKLSELQARWLNKQWEFEKNAWVIILGPEKTHYIFKNPSKWDDPLICTGYEEVALRILDKISPLNG